MDRDSFIPVAEQIADDIVGGKHPLGKKANEQWCKDWNYVYHQSMRHLTNKEMFKEEIEKIRKERNVTVKKSKEAERAAVRELRTAENGLEEIRNFKPYNKIGKHTGKS